MRSGLNLFRTQLYNWHVTKDAVMSNYNGWEMPISYRHQTNSVAHTRKRASLFDISYMHQISVYGHDSVQFLESVLVSDIKTLPKNKAMFSLMTDIKSCCIIAETVVVNTGEKFSMTVSHDKDVDYLQKCESIWKVHGKDVYMREDYRSLVSLQGPMAPHIIRICCAEDKSIDISNIPHMSHFNTFIAGVPVSIIRNGYIGEDGFEISVENSHVQSVVNEITSFHECRPGGWADYDVLRLEAGICLHEDYASEFLTPFEANLVWTMTNSRARAMCSTASVDRKLVGVVTREKHTLNKSDTVFNMYDEPVGKMVSGAVSPTLNKGIGIACINNSYYHKGSKGLYVSLYGSRLPVTICDTPFVLSIKDKD